MMMPDPLPRLPGLGNSTAPPLLSPSGPASTDFAPFPILAPAVLQMLEALPDAYLVLAPDPAFTILAANAAYVRALVTSREALQGRPLLEAFPPPATLVSTDGDQLLAALQHTVRTGQPQPPALQRYDLRAPDGTAVEKYWELSDVPVLDAQGQVQYVLHKAVDVTAQVQAHTQTQDVVEVQDRLWWQVLRQVPAAVAIVTGAEHRYTFFNDRYQALIQGRAVLGRSVAEVLPELVTQGLVARLNTVYRTGQTAWEQQKRLILHDPEGKPARTVSLDFTYQALRDRQGHITGVLAFIVEHSPT